MKTFLYLIIGTICFAAFAADQKNNPQNMKKNDVSTATVLPQAAAPAPAEWLTPDRYNKQGNLPCNLANTDQKGLIIGVDATDAGDKTPMVFPAFLLRNNETMKNCAFLRITLDSLANVAAFELILPRKDQIAEVNNYVKIPLPADGEKADVTVAMPDKMDMSKVRQIQFGISGKSGKFSCRLLSVELLDADKTPLLANRSQNNAKPKLTADSPLEFFAAPGEPFAINLMCDNLADGTKIEYFLTDFAGEKLPGPGGSVTVKQTQIALDLPPRPGFFEIVFPSLDQRFGLYSFLPSDREGQLKDPFFGINSIFSVKYLHYLRLDAQNGSFASAQNFEAYFRILDRGGISRIREMAAVFEQLKTPDDLQYNAALAADINRLADQYGIKILTFYAHFPNFYGTTRGLKAARSQMQVTEYAKLRGQFAAILKLDEPSTCGVQVMNEGDHVVHSCPPDGIAAFTWYTRQLLAQNKIDTPLVGMAFAGIYGHGFSPYLMTVYAQNGFLDAVDAIAINNYDSPEKFTVMLDSTTGLLLKLAPGGTHPEYWVTECGKPFRRGAERAGLKEDLLAANWITCKAVEAKAYGIHSFFPFVMPFFEEHSNNFGLFDYQNSPHRGFAAYATLAGLLSGMDYVGDLLLKDAPAPVRVFSGRGKYLAVVIAPANQLHWDNTIAVNRFLAADGTPVTPAADGMIPAAGGWFYAELSSDRAIDKNTAVVDRLAAMKQHKRQSDSCRLIIRNHFEDFSRLPQGYLLDFPEMTLQFSVYNFTGQSWPFAPEITVNGTLVKQFDLVQMPPDGQRQWQVPIRQLATGRNIIRIADRKNNAHQVVMQFFVRGPEHKIEGMTDPGRWRCLASGNMKIDATDEPGVIRVTTTYPDSAVNFWSYPEYDLAATEIPHNAVGMSYEIKTDVPDELLTKANSGAFFRADQPPLKYERLAGRGPSHEWERREIIFTEDPEHLRTVILGVNHGKCKTYTYYLRNLSFF